MNKVYIVQEFSEDDVPKANVYINADAAISHAADLMEYGNLELESGDDDPACLPEAFNESNEDVELMDSEGRTLVRVYSTEVK